MPATRTLPDCVEDELRNAVESAPEDDPVVIWWDDGGYLREIIEQKSAELGCGFRAAERTPLELRSDAPRDRTVWYIPEANTDGLEWFKDVENTGTVVEGDIGKLAARCFEDKRLQAGSIRAAYEKAGGEQRGEIAETLLEGLNGKGGLPSLKKLNTEIILGGHEDPVEFVLEYSVENLPEGEDLLDLRDLIVDTGVDAVEGATEAETIVDRTRRWAVAEWLIEEGLDKEMFPTEYRSDPDSGIGVSKPNLKSVLDKTDRLEELASIYLGPEGDFWEDVVQDCEEVWELSGCPVESTLEHELWESWAESYKDGNYEVCAERARQRKESLEEAYGEVVWTEIWRQALDVAELAGRLKSWEESSKDGNVVELYGDFDEGTWQIDNAVMNLIVSGEPEEGVPHHPSSDSLDGFRTSLTESRYLDYLMDLGDLTADQIQRGSPFVEESISPRFFDEKESSLESGQEVVLFIVDALRFDLAHQLAESVRGELPEYEVNEERWVGTLPSSTKFGKGALTPGKKFSFSIGMEDGELVPKRNGKEIKRRRKLLENDGWSYIMEDEDGVAGWDNPRVAYYWNDFDKVGEKELRNPEELFENRIEEITEIISEKVEDWEKAYVLSDHGFVSLPSSPDLDGIYPPDGSDDVNRRWVAGTDISEQKDGVTIDEDTGLGYIEDGTEIQILTDPLQRFRNQGIPDAQFYHGGALPQEFVLNFISITEE